MANIKLTKAQIKNQDQVLQNLQKGFRWGTQHSKAVLLAVGVFVLIGGGFSLKSHFDQKAEAEIQSQYFRVEKNFMEKKTEFLTAAEAQARPPAAAKGDKAAEKTATPTKPVATGDLAKDYGTVPQDFMTVIDKAPKSKAAQMAALNLSDLQVEYKMFDDAKKTLSKVPADGKDLLSAMVLVQLGTLQADQKDCQAAIGTWQKVIFSSAAKSLHSAARLKTGLCYEALNNNAEAETMYAQIKSEDKDSASAKSAEKYLRLLQAKK